MPDGRTLTPEPADWIAAVKWLYQHIDGPAGVGVQVTGDLRTTVVLTWGDEDIEDTATAPPSGAA